MTPMNRDRVRKDSRSLCDFVFSPVVEFYGGPVPGDGADGAEGDHLDGQDGECDIGVKIRGPEIDEVHHVLLF